MHGLGPTFKMHGISALGLYNIDKSPASCSPSCSHQIRDASLPVLLRLSFSLSPRIEYFCFKYAFNI